MDRPTAGDVRALVPPQFDWVGAGYPLPAEGPDPLEAVVEVAGAELALMIGRPLASIVDPDEVLIARKAVALLVLHGAMGGTVAALTVQAKPWLRSFTAGSYSETRFSPAELAGANNSGKADVIAKLHPWRALALALWLLATPAKREEWAAAFGGEPAAAGGIFAVDVSTQGEGVWPYGVLWPS